MKLLLDQNISWRLIDLLQESYPGSAHVNEVLSAETSDRDIWIFAKENEYTIVTKDDDFEQRSVLLGHPPKVVWLRLGNCRSADIHQLLEDKQKILAAFGSDDEKSILPIP